jgi:hypothetical protein
MNEDKPGKLCGDHGRWAGQAVLAALYQGEAEAVLKTWRPTNYTSGGHY